MMTAVIIGLAWLAQRVWAISLEIAILAIIIGAFDRLFRNSSSLFRYWLWFIVLIRLCIPVDITPPRDFQQFVKNNTDRIFPELRHSSTFLTVTHETTKVMALISGDNLKDNNLKSLRPSIDPMPRVRVRAVPLMWFAAVSVLVLMALARIAIVRRITGASVPLNNHELHRLLKKHVESMGIQREVGIYSLDMADFQVPATFGIIRPKIIFPAYMTDTWSDEETAPILLHELAHIKRHDILVNMFQILLQTVYFFHPAVWYANKRIRELREELCDDVAIERLEGGCVRYSKSFLRVMENVTAKPSYGALGLGFAKRAGAVRNRIGRIMNTRYKVTLALSARSIAALVVIGFAGSAIAGLSALPGLSPDDTATSRHDYAEKKADTAETISICIAQGDHFKPSDDTKLEVAHLADKVNAYTNLTVEIDAQSSLSDVNLSATPFLYFPVSSEIHITSVETAQLSRYLNEGGFIFLDNAAAPALREAVTVSNKRLIEAVLGIDAAVFPLSNDHDVYHVFMDFDDGAPYGASVNSKRVLNGISLGGRIVGIISDLNYTDKWNDNDNNEAQLKVGVNMVVFALRQQGSIYRKHIEHNSLDKTRDASTRANDSSHNVVLTLTGSVRAGSEKITLDGKPLIPGSDYTINYTTGKISILNDRAREPRADLTISYEEQEMKSRSLDINIYDTDQSSKKIPSKKTTTLPLQARVGYEDGSVVYIMNLKR